MKIQILSYVDWAIAQTLYFSILFILSIKHLFAGTNASWQNVSMISSLLKARNVLAEKCKKSSSPLKSCRLGDKERLKKLCFNR